MPGEPLRVPRRLACLILLVATILSLPSALHWSRVADFASAAVAWSRDLPVPAALARAWSGGGFCREQPPADQEPDKGSTAVSMIGLLVPVPDTCVHIPAPTHRLHAYPNAPAAALPSRSEAPRPRPPRTAV